MRTGTPRAYNPNHVETKIPEGVGRDWAGAITGAFSSRQRASASRKRRGARRPTDSDPLAGYAPPNNGFSLSLKRIGDRIQAKFGKDVDVKYLYNIIDLGYKGEDLPVAR
jgi:hypothetical protein